MQKQASSSKALWIYKIEKPFLEAVETTLGDRYTENVENIYKITIKFIIETLIKGYNNANATTTSNSFFFRITPPCVADHSLDVAQRLSAVAESRAADWFPSNGLVINSTKPKRFFSTLKTNCTVESENSTTFLAIYLDSSLSWNRHSDYIAGKLCKNIFLLRSLSDIVTLEVLKMAY
ncbi:hypothetical protein HHI36_009847 [Cryptolaemus montrouzieri]|uniref:Uncharacterized protein n=1 Tax=Cryptolaemus montrouzieri TaxID=559131 RepID=A0ABD2MH07_9CUCU